MDKQTQATNNDKGAFAEESCASMAATADVAGEQGSKTRNRLAAALTSGKKILGRVKEKAVKCARATDGCVHEHPYQTIGVLLVVGAVIGHLIVRRGSRKGD